MFDFVKRNKITVIILIATVILGGIAIFTAIRLYSLRSQRVAPTAPESMPGAAAPTLTNNCQLTFSIAGEVTGCNQTCTPGSQDTECSGGLYCFQDNWDDGQWKCRDLNFPWREDCQPILSTCNQFCYDDSSCDNNYICYPGISLKEIVCRNPDYPEEEDCQPPSDLPDTCNDICTSDSECQDINSDYVCFDTGTDLRCRLSDNTDSTTCEPETALAECNESCSDDEDCYGSNTCEGGMCRNPNCPSETDCECPTTGTADCNEACSENSDCTGDNECINGMCRNPACSTETDCECPTGGDTPCNEACTYDSDCQGSLECIGGMCRNPSCSAETDCVCPSADEDTCNDACTYDSQCSGNEECIGGRCRNPNCTDETDCTCPLAAATPTPTPVGLPEAGVSLPTMLGIGASFLLLVGAALLIL